LETDRKVSWSNVGQKTDLVAALIIENPTNLPTLSMLFSILNRKSTLEKKCSLLIQKQILRPLITYACPIWGKCALTHLKKLQIFQNKILRIITNAP